MKKSALILADSARDVDGHQCLQDRISVELGNHCRRRPESRRINAQKIDRSRATVAAVLAGIGFGINAVVGAKTVGNEQSGLPEPVIYDLVSHVQRNRP